MHALILRPPSPCASDYFWVGLPPTHAGTRRTFALVPTALYVPPSQVLISTSCFMNSTSRHRCQPSPDSRKKKKKKRTRKKNSVPRKLEFGLEIGVRHCVPVFFSSPWSSFVRWETAFVLGFFYWRWERQVIISNAAKHVLLSHSKRLITIQSHRAPL